MGSAGVRIALSVDGGFYSFLVLLWASLLPHLQLPSAEALSEISFTNYATIFDFVDAMPFINTAILMVAVPTATMVLSVLVSWIVVRTQVNFAAPSTRSHFCRMRFQAFSSASVLLSRTRLSRLLSGVRHGHQLSPSLIRFPGLLTATRTTNGVMIQVHRELEEAGKVAGASTPACARRIVLPLIAAGIFNSWIWNQHALLSRSDHGLGARHAQEFGDLNYCLAVLGQRLGAAGFGARRAPRVIRSFGRRSFEIHFLSDRRSRVGTLGRMGCWSDGLDLTE